MTDSLDQLEEKVMLAVQTIRQLKDERTRLKEQLLHQAAEKDAALAKAEDLNRKIEEFQKLAAEHENLRGKHDEIRARVEQLLAKLEALENEVGGAEPNQKELLPGDAAA